MGPHWSLFARTGAPRRRSGAPVEGEPCGARWDPVDPEDWSTVGRPAGSLSVVSNLPRRFQQWVRVGVLRSILEILAQALHDQGYLDLQEAFIDGSFAPAKQGGARVGKTKRGSKIMAIADRQGLPVAVHVESATPHEVTLVHATLAQRFVNQLPACLIGDNAYESDRLDAELARRGVELIAPHRRTRTRRTQDGHPLRRYQRRWKVERLFAWFQNFRRIVVRYERLAENFLGMLQPASCLILLRGL
jgi:transposase